MINVKIFNNANKVAFLVYRYPEHTMQQIIKLLHIPAIDINAAFWQAVEAGYLNELDPETDMITIKRLPTKFEFGDTVNDLRDALIYSFTNLARKETDLEEQYLSNWVGGYAPHDIMIAIGSLLVEKKLAQYVIEDDGNKYTFFTLYKNREKLWGRQQFKTDPLTDINVSKEEK